MWNSPRSRSSAGKRYSRADLEVLTWPLQTVLELIDTLPVRDLVDEPILQRMEKDELLLALHQVFRALLEDDPVPTGGHPGYHEAIIAELLGGTATLAGDEPKLNDGYDDLPGEGDTSRTIAWQAFLRFCIGPGHEYRSPEEHGALAEVELHPDPERVHLSAGLTTEVWEELLLASDGVAGEFLWDEDWRYDAILDASPENADSLAELMGVDLDVTHALPRTPSPDEVEEARRYLTILIRDPERRVE